RRELSLGVQPPNRLPRVLQLRAGDVARGKLLHHRPRNGRQEANDRAVQEHGRREVYELAGRPYRPSRMNPWRAALTSATASGKRTRIASRSASACSSAEPVAWSCPRAAAVSSTAVLSVSVANCSR